MPNYPRLGPGNPLRGFPGRSSGTFILRAFANRDLKSSRLAGGTHKLKVRLGIRNLAALPVLVIPALDHRTGTTAAFSR